MLTTSMPRVSFLGDLKGEPKEAEHLGGLTTKSQGINEPKETEGTNFGMYHILTTKNLEVSYFDDKPRYQRVLDGF